MKKLVCAKCDSDNIEMRAWVNPNTDKICDMIDYGECYCNNCRGLEKTKEE